MNEDRRRSSSRYLSGGGIRYGGRTWIPADLEPIVDPTRLAAVATRDDLEARYPRPHAQATDGTGAIQLVAARSGWMGGRYAAARIVVSVRRVAQPSRSSDSSWNGQVSTLGRHEEDVSRAPWNRMFATCLRASRSSDAKRREEVVGVAETERKLMAAGRCKSGPGRRQGPR